MKALKERVQRFPGRVRVTFAHCRAQQHNVLVELLPADGYAHALQQSRRHHHLAHVKILLAGQRVHLFKGSGQILISAGFAGYDGVIAVRRLIHFKDLCIQVVEAVGSNLRHLDLRHAVRPVENHAEALGVVIEQHGRYAAHAQACQLFIDIELCPLKAGHILGRARSKSGTINLPRQPGDHHIIPAEIYFRDKPLFNLLKIIAERLFKDHLACLSIPMGSDLRRLHFAEHRNSPLYRNGRAGKPARFIIA